MFPTLADLPLLPLPVAAVSGFPAHFALQLRLGLEQSGLFRGFRLRIRIQLWCGFRGFVRRFLRSCDILTENKIGIASSV